MTDTFLSVPVLLVTTTVCLLCIRAASVLDLSSRQWEVSNRNRSLVLPIHIPGYALEYLQEQELIAKFLHG